MILSLHKLIVPGILQDFSALTTLFAELGLTAGERWDEKRSRGAKFQALTGGIEIGFGQGFPQADMVLETDEVEAVYGLLQSRGLPMLEPIADCDWGARMFTVQAPGRLRLAVFQYHRPPAQRNVLEGELGARGRRFAIVVARFNQFITERLLHGALDGLRRCGAAERDIQIARVPGSFEIPAAARALAAGGRFHAVVCLGCLMRGETAHYDVIVNEVTRGIGQSAEATAVPHAFGVLTCDTLEQAIDRAGLKMGNKGLEAALSAVEMASLKAKIAGQKAPGKRGEPANHRARPAKRRSRS